MIAKNIIDILRQKHAEDLFVDECKNGPTHTASHLRFDAWVMNKSWSNPCCTGYEVKVSRSDFVSDNKWHGYLKYCNQFYFVCPPKLIDPSEIGETAGLMWISGSRAVTKKKAPYRDIEIPESIFRYILMCRAKIGYGLYSSSASDRAARLRTWLAKKKENRELGYEVAGAVREHVAKVEAECHKLQTENATLSDIRGLLFKLGLIGKPDDYVHQWRTRQQLESLSEIFPEHLVRNLRDIHGDIGITLTAIQKLKDKQEAA